jgi:hypothetical protein
MSYGGVLLPHGLCQFQWRPKRLNRSNIIYYKLNYTIFTEILINVNHTFVVKAL